MTHRILELTRKSSAVAVIDDKDTIRIRMLETQPDGDGTLKGSVATSPSGLGVEVALPCLEAIA